MTLKWNGTMVEAPSGNSNLVVATFRTVYENNPPSRHGRADAYGNARNQLWDQLGKMGIIGQAFRVVSLGNEDAIQILKDEPLTDGSGTHRILHEYSDAVAGTLRGVYEPDELVAPQLELQPSSWRYRNMICVVNVIDPNTNQPLVAVRPLS